MLLSKFDRYPNTFKAVLPFLLASICFHKKFLEQTLNYNHPIFKSKLWISNFINCNICSKVLVGRFDNQVSGLNATGIPPSLRTLQLAVQSLDEIQELRKYISQYLNSLPSEVAKLVEERIQSRFVVQGAVAFSTNDAENMKSAILKEIKEFVATLSFVSTRTGNSNQSENVTIDPTTSLEKPDPTNADFNLFMWKDGTFKIVPEGFIFPRYYANFCF